MSDLSQDFNELKALDKRRAAEQAKLQKAQRDLTKAQADEAAATARWQAANGRLDDDQRQVRDLTNSMYSAPDAPTKGPVYQAYQSMLAKAQAQLAKDTGDRASAQADIDAAKAAEQAAKNDFDAASKALLALDAQRQKMVLDLIEDFLKELLQSWSSTPPGQKKAGSSSY